MNTVLVQEIDRFNWCVLALFICTWIYLCYLFVVYKYFMILLLLRVVTATHVVHVIMH